MKTYIRIATIILFISFFINKTNAQLKVFNNGSVGIGFTTNPLSPFMLQVVGNSVFTANTQTTVSSPYIRGTNNYSSKSYPDYTWYNNDNTGIFHPIGGNIIGFTTGGDERMRINNGGVEILSPSNWHSTLTINATAPYAGGYSMRLNGVENFYVNAAGGVYSAVGFISKLKEDKTQKEVATIPDALYKVLKLRGINFKNNFPDSLKELNTNELLMGIDNEKLEEVVPEVIKTLNDGTKAVSYQDLIGLLIEAIKDQQKIIEDQNNRMEMLEKYCNINGISNINNTSFVAKLYQNNPNPFSQNTEIKSMIPNDAKAADLFIYDMQGTQIKKIPINSKGEVSTIIKGSELKAGMYMYTLVVDGKEIDTKRMILTN